MYVRLSVDGKPLVKKLGVFKLQKAIHSYNEKCGDLPKLFKKRGTLCTTINNKIIYLKNDANGNLSVFYLISSENLITLLDMSVLWKDIVRSLA